MQNLIKQMLFLRIKVSINFIIIKKNENNSEVEKNV